MSAGEVLIVSSRRALHPIATETKARRDAQRWLRSVGAVDGEWMTILDLATGETIARYQRRNGSVTRMQ
jgi:hypothetical protein